MGIFPRMGQRSKLLLPVRVNLTEYNEIPELTTITSNTSIPSVQDGPTVIQRYRNLTIGAGATLTTQCRCCGMVLIVDGDLTVNGTISMTARGAYHQPIGDHRIKNNLLPGNDILYEIDIPATADEIATFLLKEKRRYHSLDELPAIYRPTLYCRGPSGNVYAPADLGVIPAVGGAGGAGTTQSHAGNAGVDGTDRKCGGGGSGGADYMGNGGAGSAGTCYSGGSGGAGSYNGSGGSGAPYGGAGGSYSGGTAGAGGAGNPGGSGKAAGQQGGDGTGGLIVIVCSGNVIIGSVGSLQSKGVNGGTDTAGGGGGSGGGSINIFHGGSLMNDGSIAASGGAGGAGTCPGGKGGDGCVTTDHYNF